MSPEKILQFVREYPIDDILFEYDGELTKEEIINVVKAKMEEYINSFEFKEAEKLGELFPEDTQIVSKMMALYIEIDE